MNSTEKDIAKVVSSIRIKSAGFFICAGLLMLLLMLVTPKENWIITICVSAVMFAYAAYENREITKKIEDGKYRFVYAVCNSASESHSLTNKLPAVARAMVHTTKNKSIDYILSAQDAEEQDSSVEISIRAGSDGREFNVGILYLLCFDEHEDGEYNEQNLIGYVKASQEVVSLHASDFDVSAKRIPVKPEIVEPTKETNDTAEKRMPATIQFPTNKQE